MKLTNRQAVFVDEYLVDRNGTQAAMRAGYSPHSAKEQASRLLTYPYVREAVDKRSQKLARKLSITQESVIKGLLEAYEMAHDNQDPRGMIAACREIGRLCGYYAPERKQVEVSDNRLMAQLRDMSEAELLEMIGGESGLATVNAVV